MAERDPGAPPRALLRHPIAPGPGVPVHGPGLTVPMRGADVARTGIQLGPAPDNEPAERWRTPTGWHSDAQPVVARGLVFFGGFSLGERIPLLEAVDAATGAVRWQTTAPVAWAEISDSPALGGEILFAPIQAPVAGVLAVAATTGEPLWFSPFGFTSVTAPSTFRATAVSLPSTERPVASAGRRVSHQAPETRRPLPGIPSSSPAPRSPPGDPGYSHLMPSVAPCAGASICRDRLGPGPEAPPPTASFSFPGGMYQRETQQTARLPCARMTWPTVTSAGCSARMTPRRHGRSL